MLPCLLKGYVNNKFSSNREVHVAHLLHSCRPHLPATGRLNLRTSAAVPAVGCPRPFYRKAVDRTLPVKLQRAPGQMTLEPRFRYFRQTSQSLRRTSSCKPAKKTYTRRPQFMTQGSLSSKNSRFPLSKGRLGSGFGFHPDSVSGTGT
jgi:hypothetical protein